MAYRNNVLRFVVVIITLIGIGHFLKAQNINHWEMVVAASDEWKYLPGTSEPVMEWTDLGFDDSGWQSGTGGIGYGDGDDGTEINPTISLYLRKDFTLTDTSVISWAILHIDYDDAFVAYLNGFEIARSNVGYPNLRPGYDMLANTDHEASMYLGGLPDRFIINDSKLKQYIKEGENILALQIHNSSETSSDMTSNCFFSVGIKDESSTYRSVPDWFNDPMEEKSNLPIVVIDTDNRPIDDEIKIMASMKVIDNGVGKMNNFLDTGTDYDGLIGIETRGQSSQMHPKKSYSIETRNELGEGIDAGLLDMPLEEDWVLNANYMDKTLLRNAFCFHLGGLLFGDEWQPKFRFCELYLDGDYKGVYMLMEKIKRDKNRVNIGTLRPEEITGDDLTGGYIIKADKTWDLGINDYFTSRPSVTYPGSRNVDFTYVYPKAKNIVFEQKKYIQDYLVDFQNALNGEEFGEVNTGFRKYIDLASFIDFQIINELGNNVDGYRYSTYFYKKKDSNGGKLYAGPLWDFDLCFGNQQMEFATYYNRTDVWLYANYGTDESFPMHWWARLMQDEGYTEDFNTRWHTLRAGVLKTENLMAYLDDTIAYMGEAIDRNFQRWPILGQPVWPVFDPWGQTYDEEVTYFKTWLNDRLEWMDANIALPTPVEIVDNLKQDVRIYPNPVRNQFNLSFSTRNNNEINVELYDLNGKNVYSYSYIPLGAGLQQKHINIPPLQPATYFVKINQGGAYIGHQKLLIVK